MSFKSDVLAIDLIASGYKNGLQAVKSADSHFRVKNPRMLSGSLDIDTTLKGAMPQDPRWDYVVAYKKGRSEGLFWVEVHPAGSSHNCKEIKRKLQWLKEEFLQNIAPSLKSYSSRYYWVPSGGYHMLTRGSSSRELAKLGVSVVKPCVID